MSSSIESTPFVARRVSVLSLGTHLNLQLGETNFLLYPSTHRIDEESHSSMHVFTIIKDGLNEPNHTNS